nr:uncharacterized protein LOC109153501 [Ipomoea batatas]
MYPKLQSYASKYYPEGSFESASLGREPSFVWRGIWEAWVRLRGGLRWRIGDGKTVRVWGDAWLPSNDLPYVETPLYPTLSNATVFNLLNSDGSAWDIDILNDLFSARDRHLILQTYRLLMGERVGSEDYGWTVVWDLPIPPKAEYGWRWGLEEGGVWSWINKCVRQFTPGELCHFIMVCWGLWGARIKRVCDGVRQDPRDVVRPSLAFLRDWKGVRGGRHEGGGEGEVHWRPPVRGLLKLNVDASVRLGENTVGLGWVVRDWEGRYVAAGAVGKEGACLAREAEALADISTLLYQFSNICIRFVKRSANQVAHLLARDASSVLGARFWFDTGPPLFFKLFVMTL